MSYTRIGGEKFKRKGERGMYISGDIATFEGRLHSLPVSGADLTNFAIEGSGYSPDYILKQRWNKEFDKKSQIINRETSKPF